MDDINSGIPAAFFEIEVENTSEKEALYQVAFSVANPFDKSMNASDMNSNIKTLSLLNKSDSKESVKYGDLTVATDSDTVYSQTYWYRGQWQDGIVSFWSDFSSKTELKDRIYEPICK